MVMAKSLNNHRSRSGNRAGGTPLAGFQLSIGDLNIIAVACCRSEPNPSL
jgi:hypothetical protein